MSSFLFFVKTNLKVKFEDMFVCINIIDHLDRVRVGTEYASTARSGLNGKRRGPIN